MFTFPTELRASSNKEYILLWGMLWKALSILLFSLVGQFTDTPSSSDEMGVLRVKVDTHSLTKRSESRVARVAKQASKWEGDLIQFATLQINAIAAAQAAAAGELQSGDEAEDEAELEEDEEDAVIHTPIIDKDTDARFYIVLWN